jgi:cyclomaltodextrinase / maltogenic alpha-amylase / neopullulanase
MLFPSRFRRQCVALGAALLFTAPMAVAQSPASVQPVPAPPAWARSVVWYQIFVERFRNGDPTNDPTPATMYAASSRWAVPKDWTITPWTHDWFAQEPWAKNSGRSYYQTLEHRRYGGDLQGVLDKLGYLQSLGVTALYFNPLNDAPSLHKYDARSYHHIDVTFGPDPIGDQKIIASENPNDPATWKWTAADNLFRKVIDEAHRRGMKVVLDYSWNHTGVEFWAWQDVVKNQTKSAYKDWYEITAFDDPATPANEFSYKGWADVSSLPELKKVNMPKPRVSGHPFEGDLAPGPKQHVLAVSRRWLAPDGDTTRGVDGYRLDVADQIPMGFWRDYYRFVKGVKPSAYLVGEIWWEKWPNRMMDPVPYTGAAGIFDAVMFYQIYQPARSFFGHVNDSITAQQFQDSVNFQWNRLPDATRRVMMNVSATHDSPRLLTDLDNPGKYKSGASARDNKTYNTGPVSAETQRRASLYRFWEYTTLGAPHIWNGDELGMWGADDPDCRKPLWWDDIKGFERESPAPGHAGQPVVVGTDAKLVAQYQLLAQLRKSHPALTIGRLDFLPSGHDKVLLYKRTAGKETIYVALNASRKPFTVKLPESGSYRSLLTSGPVPKKQLLLVPALSSAVLQKQ